MGEDRGGRVSVFTEISFIFSLIVVVISEDDPRRRPAPRVEHEEQGQVNKKM